MVDPKRKNFLCALLGLISAPFWYNVLEFLIIIWGVCSSSVEECARAIMTVFPAFVIALAGFIAVFGIIKNLKYWKIYVWIFLAVTGLAIIYNFISFPGDDIYNTLRNKALALKIWYQSPDTGRFIYFLGKDYLNPVLVIIASVLLLKRGNLMTSKKISRGQTP